MDKNSNAFTVLFATAVCVVLAVCLAATFSSLEETIRSNKAFDKQTNVLIAMGFHEKSDASKTRAELEQLYSDRVVAKVLEVKRDMVPTEVRRAGVTSTEPIKTVVDVLETEHDVASLPQLLRDEKKKPVAERREFVAIYRGEMEGGEAVWCIPISGYGLWGNLYGFLALEEDLNTVCGITFYQHIETPGLGGEVDNVNWQHSWRGKQVLDSRGAVVSVSVKKGIVDQKVQAEKMHMVDGLAGATITGNGVTKFVKRDLDTYEPYFEKHRVKK